MPTEINSVARERGMWTVTAIPVTVLPYQPSVRYLNNVSLNLNHAF